MNEKIEQAIALMQEAMSEVPPWGAAYYACARSIEDLNRYAQEKVDER